MTALLPDTLTTDRMILRRPALQDLATYAAYYTGPRTAHVGGPKERYQAVSQFHAMAGQWALRGYGRYVMTDGETSGFGHVGVLHMDDTDTHELTWSIWDDAHEGRGYATEAAAAVLAAWTGPALAARVHTDNALSLRVAEKLGFAPDDAAIPAHYPDGFAGFRQKVPA